LSEAGYPDGYGFPVVEGLVPCSLVSSSIGEYLQTRWREDLGIEIDWKTMEWPAFLDRLYGRPPHLHLNMWLADYADPDNFLRVCFQQMSPSLGWEDEAYSELVEGARRIAHQDRRMELYRQADKTLVDEAVIILLHYGRSYLLVKPWVSKYPTSALGGRFWKDVVVEPH
jgi:oligopeptide transport system substrate-binding protein